MTVSQQRKERSNRMLCYSRDALGSGLLGIGSGVCAV